MNGRDVLTDSGSILIKSLSITVDEESILKRSSIYCGKMPTCPITNKKVVDLIDPVFGPSGHIYEKAELISKVPSFDPPDNTILKLVIKHYNFIKEESERLQDRLNLLKSTASIDNLEQKNQHSSLILPRVSLKIIHQEAPTLIVKKQALASMVIFRFLYCRNTFKKFDALRRTRDALAQQDKEAKELHIKKHTLYKNLIRGILDTFDPFSDSYKDKFKELEEAEREWQIIFNNYTLDKIKRRKSYILFIQEVYYGLFDSTAQHRLFKNKALTEKIKLLSTELIKAQDQKLLEAKRLKQEKMQSSPIFGGIREISLLDKLFERKSSSAEIKEPWDQKNINSLFKTALLTNDKPLAVSLLSKGAEITGEETGEDPLFVKFFMREENMKQFDETIPQFLLHNKADVNATCRSGKTALDWALSHKANKATLFLIKHAQKSTATPEKLSAFSV